MRYEDGRKGRDLDALRSYLSSNIGLRVPINKWYKVMADLGLGRSDRQRLSDLRAEGWQCEFDRGTKEYHIKGIRADGQLGLF